MAGVRASKARRLQAMASQLTQRSRKGRNKAPKISRTDTKKKGGKPGGKFNVLHQNHN